MFKFGKDDFKLIDRLISGKTVRNAKKWRAIYNVLKGFGIVGASVALLEFGFTLPFAMYSGLMGISLLGVNLLKVRPACIAKENEDLAKQNLMLKIQAHLEDRVVVIDGNTFRLELTATIDSTKPIAVKEILVSDDGDETIEDKEIFKEGSIEDYVRCSDNENGLLCWLKAVRTYVTEQKVTGNNKFETRQVPRDCAFMLESPEVRELTKNSDFVQQTHAYDDTPVDAIVNVPKTKARRP